MSQTSSVELFAYPWDILDRGVEPFVEECRGLGVHVLHVTTIDGFHLLAYTPDTSRVNDDLVFCRAQVEDPARLNLTLNLGLPVTPTLGDALAKVDFAWRQGVRRDGGWRFGHACPTCPAGTTLAPYGKSGRGLPQSMTLRDPEARVGMVVEVDGHDKQEER